MRQHFHQLRESGPGVVAPLYATLVLCCMAGGCAVVFADNTVSTVHQSDTVVSDEQQAAELQTADGFPVVGATSQFMPAALECTRRPLDIAIGGDGFFQLQLPNGETRYTRYDKFHPDADGQVVSAGRYLLTPPITVPIGLTHLEIGIDGIVICVEDGDTAHPGNLGQIQLATFQNPAVLSSEGSNLLAQTTASGDAVVGNASDPGFGILCQACLKDSRVEPVPELISLISAEHAYIVKSKPTRAGDEQLFTATGIQR